MTNSKGSSSESEVAQEPTPEHNIEITPIDLSKQSTKNASPSEVQRLDESCDELSQYKQSALEKNLSVVWEKDFSLAQSS